MSPDSLSISRTTSRQGSSATGALQGKVRGKVQEEVAVPPTLSGSLWNVLVKRMLRKPELLSWLLLTWEPSMKESGRLLQLLTGEMSPEWWMRLVPDVRGAIMHELVRIDDGRGIIADWLALIVREENNFFVLEEAGKWKTKTGAIPPRLLEVWCDKSFSSNDWHTALGIVVGAILPSGVLPGGKGEEIWNEERRAQIILKHLSKLKHVEHDNINMEYVELEYTVYKLQILANWEPSPELQGKKILSEIFYEWERHMDDVAKMMMSRKDWRFLNYNDYGVKVNMEIYLQNTWKGLMKLSPYCADGAGRILSRMDYWLQCKDLNCLTVEEIRREMFRWNPLDTSQREQAAVFWSRRLLSFGRDNDPEVWAALGRYVTECRTPGDGDGMAEICRNCLKALGLVTKLYEEHWTENLMEAIVCPPWLTMEQQAEWERLWADLIQRAVRTDTARAATQHLLGLATAGRADLNAARKTILKTHNTWVFPGSLEAIADWEGDGNLREEMFHKMWRKLRQSPEWKKWKTRREAIRALVAYLRKSLAQGKAEPQLVSLWLETLHGEREPAVIRELQKWQSEIMEVCPDFCPASVAVWKGLVQDSDPEIRQTAWRFMFSLKNRLEDGTGRLLLKMLREEKNPYVLDVMAEWEPLSGESFPPGFWDEWRNCFQSAVGSIVQPFVQGRKKIRQSDLKNLADSLGKMVSVGKRVIGNMATAWLAGQFKADGQSEGPDDRRVFLETFCEAMTKAIKHCTGLGIEVEIIGKDIESMQENMEAVLRLPGPPEEFVDVFTKAATGKNEFHENNYIWYRLFETFEGRDLRCLPVNVRHNLGVAAAFLYSKSMGNTDLNGIEKVFLKLGGDGMWDPDRMPAGWEEFCCGLHRICTGYDRERYPERKEMKKICLMVQAGYTIGNGRFRHLFRQTLEQFLKSAKPDLAAVAENAILTEMVRGCEMTEQAAPEGKGLDGAGQRRWVREYFRSWGQITGGNEESEGIVEFLNSLWLELEKDLFLRETNRGKSGNPVKVPTLNSGEAVFSHPQRDKNLPSAAPARLPETKPVGQTVRQQSFLLPE